MSRGFGRCDHEIESGILVGEYVKEEKSGLTGGKVQEGEFSLVGG